MKDKHKPLPVKKDLSGKIQPHSYNYPKRVLHYRGGVYPARRVTAHVTGDPELPVKTLVSVLALEAIIKSDTNSIVNDVSEAGFKLHDAVKFFLPSDIFLSPSHVILDILTTTYEGWTFTHIS